MKWQNHVSTTKCKLCKLCELNSKRYWFHMVSYKMAHFSSSIHTHIQRKRTLFSQMVDTKKKNSKQSYQLKSEKTRQRDDSEYRYHFVTFILDKNTTWICASDHTFWYYRLSALGVILSCDSKDKKQKQNQID